jgi:hypothetical protein
MAMISWVTDENQRSDQVNQKVLTQDKKIALSVFNVFINATQLIGLICATYIALLSGDCIVDRAAQ